MWTSKVLTLFVLCAIFSVQSVPHHNRPQEHDGTAEEPKYEVIFKMNGGSVQYEIRRYGKR